MANFTSNTYQMKRKILTFTNKISRHLSKTEKKFTADITYGILASGSCLLTDVVDQLHESSKKINVVDRLSKHLEKGTPASAAASYLPQVKKWAPAMFTKKGILSQKHVCSHAATTLSAFFPEYTLLLKKTISL